MKLPGYYSSGEFARMAQVSVRTIRFYDKQNILKPSYVNGSGARFYTEEDFAHLQQILLLKYLGFSFVKGTILGSVLISVFVELFSRIPPLTNDLFLAAIFGSVLYGFGIGLTLTEGASTGGTDILGRLVQRVFPYIKIGSLLLLVDAVVIISSLLTFRQVDLALYGIIALFFSSFSINVLIFNFHSRISRNYSFDIPINT